MSIGTSIVSAQSDGRISGFLLKTYEILENDSFKNIISWNTEGNGFIVHDHKAFAEEILPCYFKHSNFQSFVRQLNMYGFHKIRTPHEYILYTHSMFCRGKRDMVKEICRKAEKKMCKGNIKEKSKNYISENPEELPSKILTPPPTTVSIVPVTSGNVAQKLFNFLNINCSLLYEQCFLLEEMKKYWQFLYRNVYTHAYLLSTYKYNALQIAYRYQKLLYNHKKYRYEKDRAIKAVNTYIEVSREVMSRLCLEARHMMKGYLTPVLLAETNTSISHLH